MFNKFIRIFMIKHIEFKIFWIIFLITLLSGFFLQKVVLPLTPWHEGNGLMVGGDWNLFHSVAKIHAKEILDSGWSVFEFRPEGHPPSGFASMIYALTGIFEPWTLLPFHAVIYSVAMVSFFWITESLLSDRKIAFNSSLTIFFLMPSLVMTWGQLHKDIWIIAGVLLILAYWTRLMVGRPFSTSGSLAVLVFANLSLWWMRPYTLEITFVGQLFLLFSFLPFLVKKLSLNKYLFSILPIVITFVMFVAHQKSIEHAELTVHQKSIEQTELTSRPTNTWIELIVNNLNLKRQALIIGSSGASSNIDDDVNFDSLQDFVSYIPRAVQIGLFAPFPNVWLDEVLSSKSQLFRIVSTYEMIVIYVAFTGIAIFLTLIVSNCYKIGLQKKLAFIGLIAFGLAWILVYSIVVSNVGTLYRVRLPITLLWVSLGIVSWHQILSLFIKRSSWYAKKIL